jgi:hypothetical protein
MRHAAFDFSEMTTSVVLKIEEKPLLAMLSDDLARLEAATYLALSQASQSCCSGH